MKNRILVFVVCLLFMFSHSFNAEASSAIFGDMNGDATVTVSDIVLVRELILTGNVNQEIIDMEAFAEEVDDKFREIDAKFDLHSEYFYVETSTNLCDKDKMTEGYYIGNSDGRPVKNASYYSTDYIDLSDNTTGYISAYNCLKGKGTPYQAFFRGAFYDADKNYISGVNNHSKQDNLANAVVEVPENAVYMRVSYLNHPNFNNYMFVFGNDRVNYVECGSTYKKIPTSVSELSSLWAGKTWLTYGDSITADGNTYTGDTTTKTGSWQEHVTEKLGFERHYGRGIGGQTFKYNKKPWFANADGSYNSRNANGDMTDSTTFTVPEGCTAHYGYMASWDRITTMISDDIKDTIDLIFVSGVNDGSKTDTMTVPEFKVGATLDAEWAAAEENELQGDYDIETLEGAVASTIMKLQARCPNALIVCGTGWSGRGSNDDPAVNLGNYDNSGIVIWNEGKVIEQLCNYFSIPIVDTWGTSGVNSLNRKIYDRDAIHPNTSGNKALARSVLSGIRNMEPRF